MWKKVALLVVVAVFIIGASGGCLSGGIPNLAGNWSGQFNSTLLGMSGTVTITGLQQDSSGNFTDGNLVVTYKPAPSDPSKDIILSASLVQSDSKTDEWTATIVGEGTASQDIPLTSTTTIHSGVTYSFTFVFPHLYGCIGGNANQLSGGYLLIVEGQKIDSGTADLTKQ
jgi:hypothetical protein